jgi:CRP-like cAMP-binding protein
VAIKHHPQQNHLLRALPIESYAHLVSHLELVSMTASQVIYEAGGALRHVYFPTDAIISLLYVTEDGASAELAVVGNEGLVSVALFMGGETTPNRAIVQSTGFAYRLNGAVLKQEFSSSAPLQYLLLRYTQALFTLMSQTAVCNRHHNIHQQLCRWLLLSLDRSLGNQLLITHEMIAERLGVRRESVSEAAARLQSQGLIKYIRGRITVLNRAGLEQASCECYAVVKNEFNRLLPEVEQAPG